MTGVYEVLGCIPSQDRDLGCELVIPNNRVQKLYTLLVYGIFNYLHGFVEQSSEHRIRLYICN